MFSTSTISKTAFTLTLPVPMKKKARKRLNMNVHTFKFLQPYILYTNRYVKSRHSLGLKRVVGKQRDQYNLVLNTVLI